ncbi:MAG: polyprenyl diphosphate synthase [Candidatus Micrarchaeota archaeon]
MKLKSIAIIPDGNRRFAKKNALNFQNAYMQGFRKVEEVMGWADAKGVRQITFWALSLENYKKRSRFEMKILFELMRRKLRGSLRTGEYSENGIKIKFFGKLELLPPDVRDLMAKLEAETSGNSKELSIAIAYSGREEIVNAAKRIAIDFYGKNDKLSKLTEGDFEKYLYSPMAPDLIIRTGEVSRLSGFLPWQATYSELYFCRKLWPEFDETDFNQAVEFYNETQRRFGK